jgi:DNA polymerase-3 subunit delta
MLNVLTLPGKRLLYIFWGEDDFSREEALQEIKEGLVDQSLLSTNTSILDGQKLTLNDLRASAGAMPFLAPRRLVIVRGLLERFEPRDNKPSRPKKSSGSTTKPDESESLADCLTHLPETTVLVLTDNIEIKKGALQNNPLFQAISGKAQVKQFPVLRGTRLFQWVQDRVTRKGGSISRQATEVLMQIIGGDLFSMSNEIDKLVAYTGALIEEKDIRAVVSALRKLIIFAMIDAIIDRKAGTAQQILQKLLQNGIVPPQILVLIARQVQMLVQVREMKSLKKPSAEIQAKLGVFNPFAWEKLSGRAERYSLDRLKTIYQNLLETDLAIKTGRYEGDLAVSIPDADLCTK